MNTNGMIHLHNEMLLSYKKKKEILLGTLKFGLPDKHSYSKLAIQQPEEFGEEPFS